MPLCLDCIEQPAERWRYRTVEQPCDQCGDEYSHTLEFD